MTETTSGLTDRILSRPLRDLPWRQTRDPWRILVAEVMLQQTQVDRVIPKWYQFVAAFPSPASCAQAPLGDVLRRWQGLGYPRRARHLHLASQAIGGGPFPDDLAGLLALPGVGPYTARAVLAFAFERDVGLVDTNIARILARTSGHRLTPTAAQALADSLVPPTRGWAWNQRLMDLGASTCRPAPDCAACPLAESCAWNLAGRPAPDPATRSAGVSTPQAPFEGSDRQARGRVLAAISAGPQPVGSFDRRILDSLVGDGLVVIEGDAVGYP